MTGGASQCMPPARWSGAASWKAVSVVGLALVLPVAFSPSAGLAQGADQPRAVRVQKVPPRVMEAQRFLARRGWTARQKTTAQAGTIQTGAAPVRVRAAMVRPRPETTATASWQPLGPAAVATANYGLVTGRVSSMALDPADTTGNRVYLGTTGGGVWLSQNADTALAANVLFAPLTDTLAALSGAVDASISIGAITVQPGGTGVILAGTGDPNDALDSYYGAGILRSFDGGNSWNLIQATTDVEQGLGIQDYAFAGEGFAGFAWSTVNTQLVVAAVSQTYEGVVANATQPNASYEGLYYSTDSGASWHLATITDTNGQDVQGPVDAFTPPDGNAATAVVWNPVRRVFMAAVRFHGYYQSADGAHWTRLTAQPGAGLTVKLCPTNPTSLGSVDCPMFRGALAVNPVTGDTFAWTVDIDNQDQGIWQDQCGLSGGACSNQSMTFTKRWSTAALETNTGQGAVTIENGDYNLALAAVPSGQDTLLLAGANDLWRCSLAASCVWRNTTNASVGMCAQVGGYQHALAWNPANPLEIFVGNDSGLWRSTDAIAETGTVCTASDATHFQNLNGGLGSLAEVESMSPVTVSPYTMMTGLGANGTAGVKSTTEATADWPQILSGEGGPVAVDPINGSNWYVNNQAGVSIHLCAQTGDCTPAAFDANPVVNDADVNGDGSTMTTPAPFLVDPLDVTQLLIGTCRVWRGPANGSGWSGAIALSPFLDGVTGNSYCSGDALIRSMAAMALGSGGEAVYVGMYGAADGGATKAGHVLRATFTPGNGMPAWQDLTLNPVGNDARGMNAYGLDISSIYIDPHDTTGNTVYVTVDGIPDPVYAVRVVYRSTDGGAHWAVITSNLPWTAANSLVVDPQDANTVYLATDAGVFSTRQIATCASAASSCWSAYGTGLPEAPVVTLSAAPATASMNVLTAGTYGRGVWQIPLWTGSAQLATAAANPTALTFAAQAEGTSSSAQDVTLENTGSVALTPTAVGISGDFSESDNCANATVNANASCVIHVTFAPTQTGTRTGQLTVSANIAGGQLTAGLSGTGATAGAIQLAPTTVSFGQIQVKTTSAALQVTVENSGGVAVAISSANVSGPFVLASNGCGSSLAANSQCQVTVEFAPTQTGTASGTLTVVDSAGTQAVALNGTGGAAPTDALSPMSLAFPATVTGQLSPAQTVALANNGDFPLTGIAVSSSAGFQTSNNCGTTLAARSSCAISVIFSPTQTGSQSGTLTVSDGMDTQTLTLTGMGLQPAAIGVSPSQLSFATQQLGAAGTSQWLTVSNSGGSPMANVGFQITGAQASSFSIGTSNCGATLTNGASCTVQVMFAPVSVGGNAAVLTVTTATLGVKAVSVALSGTGTSASGLNVSPGQMTFTEATLGQASAAQTATISNTSNVSASGLTLTVTAPFSLTQTSCGTSLAAGASCSAAVVFTPTANGAVTGSLTASAPAFSNPATVTLNGVGGAAGSVGLQPALLSFPATGVGARSSAQTVTVTNSSGAVTLTDVMVSVSAGFQLTANTCAATLGPGSSCTVGVEFVPTSAGQQTGSLTVASSMLPASAVAPLSGMGFDFTSTVNGGTSQSVTSGQTASFALTLTPLSGSNGTFTFQCGELPANAACRFNPTSVTVAANTTGSVTVLVATGQSQSAAMTPEVRGWRALQAVCGLLLLPLAWKRRRSILLVLAGLILTGSLSSCAGSGGGGGGTTGAGGLGNTNTPAGTYSIPVTVTASGVSHQVTLSLTVE